jgi:uncharacterized protein YbaP (TraB family)
MHCKLPTRLILLLWMASAISLNAQKTTPRYQGLLWEISGKGIKHPSYLYGTMHVPEKLAFNLSDSFFVALRSVDVVALETDHDLWQEFTKELDDDDLQRPVTYDDTALEPNSESRDLYGANFHLEAPPGQAYGALFAYKPVMTNEFLFRSNQGREDNEEDTYLDLFIFQAGRKLGKKVIGLEDMHESYASVMRSRIPDDKEEESRTYVPYYGIAEAYRQQDLNKLDSLNRLMSPGKNFQKHMLTIRNEVMADGIDSIAQRGERIFAAVGAAHLPGSEGVIEMLRARGYTMRPVQFVTDIERKDMADIENMKYPVTLSRQWASDSSWSVVAPGKFYTTIGDDMAGQSLCADMSNGAYYVVSRYPTFGNWVGRSPDYISNQIDSIVYERVPGKIQERKRFNSPYPGHEITTRTRRGDIIRYKVFVTPVEIVMFIAGGTRDYAAGEESTKFINSAELHLAKSSKSGTLAPSGGGYALTFPAPIIFNRTNDNESSYHIAATQATTSDSTFYLFKRVRYDDYHYIEEDTFELNIITEKLAEQFTKKPPVMTLVSGAKYPTLDGTFRDDRDSAYYHTRVVIHGPNYYLLATRSNSPQRNSSFFESFSVVPDRYSAGFEVLVDTIVRFTTRVPVQKTDELSVFQRQLVEIGKEAYQKGRNRYNDDEYDAPEEDFGCRYVYLPTGDRVAVVREESPAYRTPALDSFQRMAVKRLTNEKSLVVKTSKWTQSGDTLVIGDFLLQDTNSVRGIRSKVYMTNERSYILGATIDLNDGPNQFVETFFASFLPTDTLPLEPIEWGQRKMTFLESIYSTDSLERGQALAEMHEYGVLNAKPADYQALVEVIDHPKFLLLKHTHRDWLLSAVGETHHKGAHDFLTRYHRQYPDSARLQLSVIEAIARIKTKQAFETTIDLLDKYPYSGSNIYAIFNQFSDTLPLAQKVYSDMLRLTDNTAYTPHIYDLTRSLEYEGMIKPKAYKSERKALIEGARYILYRARVQEEEQKELDEEKRSRNRNSYNTDSRPRLENQLRLLRPYWVAGDQEVRDLYDQALRLGPNELKINVLGILSYGKQKLPDDVVKPLLDKEEDLYPLFDKLMDGNSLELYTHYFKDTMALVRSMLKSSNSSGYRRIDSMEHRATYRTTLNKAPANLYLFDVKYKKDKQRRVGYVIMRDDLGIVPNKGPKHARHPAAYLHLQTGQSSIESDPMTDTEREEFVRKMLGSIRFEQRARYQSGNGSGYRRGYDD